MNKIRICMVLAALHIIYWAERFSYLYDGLSPEQKYIVKKLLKFTAWAAIEFAKAFAIRYILYKCFGL